MSESSGHSRRDIRTTSAADSGGSGGQGFLDIHRGSTPESDEYRKLRILAEMLWDAQKTRIGMSNRAERAEVLPEIYKPHIENMEEVEHKLALALRKQYRVTVPPRVRQWQQDSPGIGEHLLARLLGCIGDPVWAFPYHWEGAGKTSGNGPAPCDTQILAVVAGEDLDGGQQSGGTHTSSAAIDEVSDDGQPQCDTHSSRAVVGRHLVADPPYRRMVSQLWSYCGVGDPTRKRRSGMGKDDALAAGKPLAKALCRLLAESCVKANRGPYREIYDLARVRYAIRDHAEPCIRCGPAGRPAPEGSPWSAAHQHGAALRKVSKEILRDLWTAAGGPSAIDTYRCSAPGGQ